MFMLTVMLGGIAAISLVVGGIGIMNIMMVTVTERTREIGIRKAIGASRGTILLQFLMEAVVQCMMGCYLGIFLSWAILQIVNTIVASLNMTFRLNLAVVLIAVVFCFLIGIVFGMYPANKTAYSYPITDLDNLPAVSADSSAMTEETVYFSPLIKADSASLDDILLVVVGDDGELKLFVRQNAAPGEEMPGGGPGAGGSGQGGGFPSGSSGGAVKIFEPYTLEKIAVASVTSQEHMTVTITVDEQDISRLYGEQAAMITVDALGGEQFDASVTQIAGTGENSGGSSKFTVELTLEKSGEMLPGMTASAFITVDTASNVPCVPVAALDQDGTKTIVYTSCDETGSTLGTPVAVTTGASDGEYVQIVEGLSEGQTCYYAYYDTLAESNAPKQSGISFRLPKRW